MTIPDGNTHRGYTDHEHLDNLSLIHMNGRVYDPVIGRFLSADPLVQAPYDGQSLNRYSYVFNNPLSFIDPSGYRTALHQYCNGVSCGAQPTPVMEEVFVTAKRETQPAPFEPFRPSVETRGSSERADGGRALEEVVVTGERIAPDSLHWTPTTAVAVGSTNEGQSPSCTYDSDRARAAREDPVNPKNLAAGTYPSRTSSVSIGYWLGVQIENRFVADFTTRTIHQMSTNSLQLGYRFGGSWHWSGGPGNRNFTAISAAESSSWGESLGASIVFGVGGAVSVNGLPFVGDADTWTRSIAVGLDLGISEAFGQTQYLRAWPVDDLPGDFAYLAEFYDAVYSGNCGR